MNTTESIKAALTSGETVCFNSSYYNVCMDNDGNIYTVNKSTNTTEYLDENDCAHCTIV